MSNLERYAAKIAACGLAVGMRVGIGNGRDGEIVRLSFWGQGVCVKLDAGGYEWSHYYDVIKR